MHFKYISLCLLLSSLYANDINESKVFLDKYLPTSKTSKFKNLDCKKSYDVKISSIKSMKEVDKDTNKTASNTVKNIYKSDDLTKQATNIQTYVNSKEFHTKLKKAKDDILYDKKTNWQQYIPTHLKTKDNKLKIDRYVGTEKLYIIISSSIPEITLKNYMTILSRVNNEVTFVLRGVIGSHKKIMPTLNWIKKLLGDKYQFNIIIEPRITKKYNITKVPAILYIKDYNLDSEDFWVYYGDIAPKYALEKINEDANSIFLSELIDRLN